MTITTSGVYNYAPAVGEVVLTALSRLQIRGPAVLADHMYQARAEANLMQAEWSNRGPNLWAVDLQTVALTQGTATYAVPAETVMILDAYITTAFGSSTTFNRVITPFSRTEYAALPNPQQQAPPTTYWFDRLISPTITLWPVPDGSATYTLSYYRYRQVQDAVTAGGLGFEIPYRWIDAAAAGMSHRLARHFAPQLEQIRKTDATEAYNIAAAQDTENVNLYIAPMIGSYYIR